MSVWNQDLAFARQVLYHMSHTRTLFALVIFHIGSCIFARSRPGTTILLFITPHSWSYQPKAPKLVICWDGVLVTFCLGWSWMVIIMISAAGVPGIAGVSHYYWSYHTILDIEDHTTFKTKQKVKFESISLICDSSLSFNTSGL
jgi:hypothetical protein